MSMFLLLVVIKMNKIFNVVMRSNILNILENKNVEFSGGGTATFTVS